MFTVSHSGLSGLPAYSGTSCHILPDLSGFLKLWRKIPGALISYLFHDSKASTMWITLSGSAVWDRVVHPPPLNQFCSSFCHLFLVSENFFGIFLSQVGNLSGWDLSPWTGLCLFPCRFYSPQPCNSTNLLNNRILSFSTRCSYNIKLANVLFLSKLHLLFLFAPFIVNLQRVITHNHVTESIVGCLEISSKEIYVY